MPKKPNRDEQELMTALSFKTVEELVDWLNEPDDPIEEQESEPVYLDDDPDSPELQELDRKVSEMLDRST